MNYSSSELLKTEEEFMGIIEENGDKQCERFFILAVVFLQKDRNAMPLMVVGYLSVHSDTNEMYDYLTVIYPQGWLSDNSLLMIDHEKW